MKYISYSRRKRLARLRRSRTRKSRIRKQLLLERRKFLGACSSGYSLRPGQLKKIRLPAPQIFTLIATKWRRRLLKFLNDVRRAAKTVKTVSIDLGPIKRLNPCGTLLFVAEINRLLETYPDCHFQASRPSDPIVEQLFQHIGLLKLLGVSHRLKISHRRVKDWTFHAGTKVDLTGLQSLQTRLTDRLGEELAFDLLSAMQEAITNAVHHAYIKPRPDGIKCDNQGWWVFAECDDEGTLYLSVCDLGVGIRKTLPLRGTWPERAIEAILNRLGATSDLDAKYIKAALELGATRTGKGNRGKGLDEMLDLVKSAYSGSLRIFSDRGMYTYNGTTRTEKILDYDQSIMGTLIQWSFDTQTVGARELKDEQND